MMPYGHKNTKGYAEIFTSAGLVFKMIMEEGIRPGLEEVDKTLFDPAVGHGQFPCAELVMKLFYQVGRLNETVALRALKSLYGMDIQPASVGIAREHLIATLVDSYRYFTGKEFKRIDEARAIVEGNIMVGDNLKAMGKWAAPQQELF